MDNNKNKGFTLIEAIIVIAIMALVTGVSVSIFSWIKSNRLKSLAGNLDNSISELRTETLSKSGKYELKIYYDSSNKKYISEITKDGASYQKEIIGNGGDIYVKSSSGNEYHLKNGYTVYIYYNKADGSFQTVSCYKTGFHLNNVHEIYVNYQGKMKTIKLIKLTGKHYIE